VEFANFVLTLMAPLRRLSAYLVFSAWCLEHELLKWDLLVLSRIEFQLADVGSLLDNAHFVI